MRENRIRRIWAEGGSVVNGWLAIANSFSAEIMANEAFDSMTVDLQHGMVDFQAAVTMLQAISSKDPTPLARVWWNDPAAIMKILDAGAYGVVCPMINNRVECESFVGACRYAPAGYRSFGPARGLLYGGTDYAAEANDTILTFAMIETREALDSLDEIMAVEGLDAVYVGPNDLATSLGYEPSLEPKEGEVIEAVDVILATAHKHGLKAGIHCPSGAIGRRMIEKGFRFVSMSNDSRLLAAAARAEIAAARAD